MSGNKRHTACADPEGGEGTGGPNPPPPKNHKSIGFLINTGLDPSKNHKATKPAFNLGSSLGHQRNAWRAIWPLLLVLGFPYQSKTNLVKVGPPLKKTCWIRACTVTVLKFRTHFSFCSYIKAGIHKILTGNGRTGSHSDYSAGPRVLQFLLASTQEKSTYRNKTRHHFEVEIPAYKNIQPFRSL